MKKAIIIIVICLIGGYLIFAAVTFQDKPKEGVCAGLDITIINENSETFLEEKQVEKMLAEKGLSPQDKQIKDINTDEIASAIAGNQMIKKAEVYVANDNAIKINVYERTPILRVIPESGDSYYIDDEGKRMPLSTRYTAYLPVATGSIKEQFALDNLYPFAHFLWKDKFWNAQIEQIVVRANGEVEFIPRVGDQRIILGKVDGFREKLDKLMAFYQKGQNETGWNKYSVINLKYDKQVVCTKR
ncbi:cell division protein FtsQ/DivIB [Dysgonomonas sp. 25]|uniref:cell division protein FtsQ/DivIB n=1 Tax=Dysgonomonas sp. 25 TaxID=2302933 RepID=UPI0013D749E1|nr:hypothetical protein [Dysgonomonas sp. 25]NDV68709.1 hypothetical protein [Dysgonomonas sp. 25]